MNVTLQRILTSEFPSWLDRSCTEYARSHGEHSLGLSVFGFNTDARGLYDSLGYETTSVKILKNLI